MPKKTRHDQTIPASFLMKSFTLLFLFCSNLVLAASERTRRSTPLPPYMIRTPLLAGKIPMEIGTPSGLAFLDAVAMRDLEAVNQFIQNGTNLDEGDTHTGFTPLHQAAYNASVDIINSLVEAGANTELVIKGQYTPLAFSVSHGITASVKELLRLGSNPFITIKPENHSLLHLAAGFNYPELIPLLVAAKIKLELRDAQNYTALALAVSKNHTGSVAQLILLNADVNAPIANRHKDFDTTVLLSAVIQGNKKMVELLLDAGANPNSRNSLLNTALHNIAVTNQANFIQPLHAAGALLSPINNERFTPIMLAVASGSELAVKEFLHLGVNINDVDEEGLTLFHCAVAGNQPEMLQTLFDLGLKLEHKNNKGETPLAYAEQKNKSDCVKKLIALGANVDARCKYGSAQLNAEGSIFFRACLLDHYENAKLLLQAGANIEDRSSDGFTPFLMASAKTHYSIMNLLKTYGANVNAYCDKGMTAYHHAVELKNIGTIPVLRELGADPNILQQDLSATPLMYAAILCPECIEPLVLAGANLDMAAKGATALHVALTYGKLESLRILIELGADYTKPYILKTNGVATHISPLSVAAKKGDAFYKLILSAEKIRRPQESALAYWFGRLLLTLGVGYLSKLLYAKWLERQAQLELHKQEAVRKASIINRRNQTILHALNEIIHGFNHDILWEIKNQGFSLAKTERSIIFNNEVIPANVVWNILSTNLIIPGLKKNSDAHSLVLLVEKQGRTQLEIDTKPIRLAIKSALNVHISQQPKARLAKLQPILATLAKEVVNLKQQIGSLELVLKQAAANVTDIINRQERVLRRLNGRNPQEFRQIEKLLEAITLLITPFIGDSKLNQNFQDNIIEVADKLTALDNQMTLLLTTAVSEKDYSHISHEIEKNQKVISHLQTLVEDAQHSTQSLSRSGDELLLKLDNTVTTLQDALEEEENSLAKARAHALRVQTASTVKKQAAHHQHTLEEQARMQRKEEWAKKQAQEQEIKQQELIQQAAKAAASSASSSSTSTTIRVRNPEVEERIISLGDLLQRCENNNEPNSKNDYKYALLAECLRLFEVIKQDNQHPIAKQIRNALMHNHRYIDLESLCAFVQFIAHAPGGARENSLKLEDVLRSELVSDSFYQHRLQQALDALRSTELYRTQARSETEIPTARVYLESMAYLLNDLKEIQLKESNLLSDFPDKVLAVKGIMICVGECQQKLLKLERSLILNRFINCKKQNPQLHDFIKASRKMRENFGHEQQEIQILGAQLQQFKRRAALMVESFDGVLPQDNVAQSATSTNVRLQN